MNARAAAAASALSALAFAHVAAAELTLRTEVSPKKVEVGDRFTARLSIASDTPERLGDPQLAVPDGVQVFGQSVSQGSGVSITWMLTAHRAGKFKIGPASVETSKGRVRDKPVAVEVVPAGTLPKNPPPLGGQRMDPFNMLRGFGGMGFPGLSGMPGFPDEPEGAPQLPALPEGYAIERAPDPVAFLRATAEPHKVVVGEQVTLSGYAYAGRGDFGAAFFAEPSRDDFLAVSMGDDDGAPKYPFDLSGQRWLVSRVASYALFPLKAGKLKVGSMSIGFSGPGYSNAPQGLLRKSAPLEVEVVEPPLQGRPPGYHVGDVGHYTLSAQVQPREVPLDGSISVVAKLEGTGNLPFALVVPEQAGVHFLEPQLVEQIAPRRGIVQGFRTFTYVVELTHPGDLDLGEVTLPFYDPRTRAYGIARAALGKVKVTGTAKAPLASSTPSKQGPSLKNLLTPPAKLDTAPRATPSYLPSRAGYWLLLFGLPLSMVAAFGLTDLAKLLQRRFAERRGSLASALDEALAQVSAAQHGDAATLAGAAERALFLAIEKATGLKARGVLKAELGGVLAKAELPRELAEQAATLLGRCDDLRFAGAGADLARFVAEARDVCQKLGQRKAPSATGSAS